MQGSSAAGKMHCAGYREDQVITVSGRWAQADVGKDEMEQGSLVKWHDDGLTVSIATWQHTSETWAVVAWVVRW